MMGLQRRGGSQGLVGGLCPSMVGSLPTLHGAGLHESSPNGMPRYTDGTCIQIVCRPQLSREHATGVIPYIFSHKLEH